MPTDVEVCSACNNPAPADTQICRACKKCRKCRKHYRCSTSHKKITHHCPEFKPQCAECSSCQRYCKCWSCDSCKRKYRGNATNHYGKLLRACKACKKCDDCCSCVKCLACYKLFDSKNDPAYCATCKACEDDCRCPAVAFTNDHRRIKFHDSKTFEVNPSKRYVSAEIEVAGCKSKRPHLVNAAIDKYGAVIKGDGSLPYGGFEINTSPANGDFFIKEIEEICESIEKQRGFIQNCCGLHVHVDARDFDYLDLRRLALLYSKVEEALYDLVKTDRKNSHYCRPCGKYYAKSLSKMTGMDKQTMSTAIQRTIRGQAADNYREFDGSRYHGLNLHAYFEHKTVECRMHHGSIDPQEITKWGILWASLLDYAKTRSDRDIEGIKESGFELLIEIAPTENLKVWLREKTPTPIRKEAVPATPVANIA